MQKKISQQLRKYNMKEIYFEPQLLVMWHLHDSSKQTKNLIFGIGCRTYVFQNQFSESCPEATSL